uniref:Secreted protein n=1 Tax=Attheya septentrionalis TaxID=420275 RepID=A0A7S2XMV0_9STRA
MYANPILYCFILSFLMKKSLVSLACSDRRNRCVCVQQGKKMSCSRDRIVLRRIQYWPASVLRRQLSASGSNKKVDSLVKERSKTNPNMTNIATVVICIHAVLPVPG